MAIGEKKQLVARRHAACGFTLLEVLVALTLTAVVLSVGAQMAISGLRSEKHAAAIIAAMDRDSFLADVLRDDLAYLLVLDEQPCLTLTAGVPQQLQLTTATPMEDQGSMASQRPTEVTYLLSRADLGSTARLVRRSADLTRTEKPPVVETVAESVRSWQLDVWHEGKWTRTPGKKGAPELLRVEVQWADEAATSLVLPVRIEGV
ncbi:MAG: prepilin-type N-terminal cleavage/methylation domain-containing protein [Gemmatimonadaceae bacterium]|nr:prepilin-type N-terminal cleavage/methylation domain-containing protein [Gemmatimonadaceae bacterium]